MTFKAAIAALALLATACTGRNANSSMAAADPNAPDTVDGLNPEYKIIYNLPEEEFVQTDTAANASNSSTTTILSLTISTATISVRQYSKVMRHIMVLW